MALISLIHPSRGRAEKSFMNSSEWLQKAGCDVELLVGVDLSDPTRDRYKELYGSQAYEFPSTSVVQCTNFLAQKSKGDILLYLSDDFKCVDNWGLGVLEQFEGNPLPLLVKVDDCLQNFDTPVLTIPIMNRALYQRLGYFWHPGYKSMFVDEDLYWTTRKLGALKYAAHLKFEHQHVSVGKAEDDETYRRSSANWNQGKDLFRQRKGQGFPV